MDDLVFYYTPNSNVTLEVTSTSISKFQSKFLNESLTEINSNSSYILLIEMNFRECIIGEIYNNQIQSYFQRLSNQ